MGRFFLGIVFIVASQPTTKAQTKDTIQLPAPPQTELPRSRGEKGAQEDYKRRRQQLDQLTNRDSSDSSTPENQKEKQQERELLEKSLEPIAFHYAINMFLQYNFLSTSGSERQDYTVDPSAAFNFLWRPGSSKDINKLTFWTGFRWVSFTGSGVYKDVHANYSFNYLGPIIGLGTISLVPQDVGRGAFRTSETMRKARKSRHGFFLLAGAAALYKEVRIDGFREGEGDFDTNKISYDAPGVWSEFHYAWIHYNSISVNFLAGAQTGEGKIFYYGGIGFGGWW